MEKKNGVELIEEIPGSGVLVQKKKWYETSLRLWLNKGEPIIWKTPFGLLDELRVEDEGRTLISKFRYDREFLIAGLYYGIDGMRVGGIRKLRIAPHLAFREDGVEGMIPANALLTAEIKIFREVFID